MKYHVKNEGRRRRLWWDNNPRYCMWFKLRNNQIIYIDIKTYEVFTLYKNPDKLHYWLRGQHSLDEALHAVKEAMK